MCIHDEARGGGLGAARVLVVGSLSFMLLDPPGLCSAGPATRGWLWAVTRAAQLYWARPGCPHTFSQVEQVDSSQASRQPALMGSALGRGGAPAAPGSPRMCTRTADAQINASGPGGEGAAAKAVSP